MYVCMYICNRSFITLTLLTPLLQFARLHLENGVSNLHFVNSSHAIRWITALVPDYSLGHMRKLRWETCTVLGKLEYAE